MLKIPNIILMYNMLSANADTPIRNILMNYTTQAHAIVHVHHTLACHPEMLAEGGYQSEVSNRQKKLTSQISWRKDTLGSCVQSVSCPTQAHCCRKDVRQ